MSAVTEERFFSTRQVMQMTGLTYRQLDYMARSFGSTPGSGRPRLWRPNTLRCLTIAQALADACSINEWCHRTTPFPVIARIAIRGPVPPFSGWAAYRNGQIAYGPTPIEVLADLDGAIVARIPETDG